MQSSSEPHQKKFLETKVLHFDAKNGVCKGLRTLVEAMRFYLWRLPLRRRDRFPKTWASKGSDRMFLHMVGAPHT